MRPAKGVHITLPWDRVRNDIAAIVPAPRDRRLVFVIPWGQHTYVGTTDTEYDGPLDDPRCTADDTDYLLDALNGVTTVGATRDDVVGAWAGLRPLLRAPGRARTTDLSRRHAVRVSDGGVVTVTGGKLTTDRRMAADAVDAATRELARPSRGRFAVQARSRFAVPARSRTKHLRLIGGEGIPPAVARLPEPGARRDPSVDEHLAGRYGTEAAVVRAIQLEAPGFGEPLVTGLPYLAAEAIFAVRHEMARTLDDVLSRRTRARVLDRDAAVACAPAVAELLAPELAWSAADLEREISSFRAAVATDRG
jgi:glycerol-3-phosphate dehydrogenase